MNILFTLLLCVACTQTVQAQNTIESIRKEYQGVKGWIELMCDSFPADGIPPEYYELIVKQNLPATGGHEEIIRMYYGELESEEEGDPYPLTFCALPLQSTTMLPASFTKSIFTMTKGR